MDIQKIRNYIREAGGVDNLKYSKKSPRYVSVPPSLDRKSEKELVDMAISAWNSAYENERGDVKATKGSVLKEALRRYIVDLSYDPPL